MKSKNANLIKRGNVWYFRKMVGGRLQCVSLETTDLVLARARRAALARKMGLDKWAEIDGLKAPPAAATIGSVLVRYTAARQLQLNPRTYSDNAWALRHIVKSVRRLANAAEVDALPASVLTGELVRSWQQHCLAAADHDKLKRDSAAVSCNSVLIQARSVFSKAVFAHQVYEGLALPDLKGFRETPRLTVLKRDQYHKPEDELLRKLWSAASRLREDHWIECSDRNEHGTTLTADARAKLWLVFHLASSTGLRRGELIHLRWRWFLKHGAEHFVRTCFEPDFVPKGKRERDVPVTPTLEQECRQVALEHGWPMQPSDYVLPGAYYQREDLFRELGDWMNALGWTRRQKAHELRKVFASDLTEQSDAYDAMIVLGHQDIKTTARYAARKKIAPVDQALRYAAPNVAAI